jgi:putative ABC transport system substrate-binding protein
MSDMKRRAFITLLGGAVATWPLAARAQQAGRPRTIGILVPAAAGTPHWQGCIAAFREGLKRLDWSDGGNVRIEERWAADSDALHAQAAELVRIRPDVILTAGASAARPMYQANSEIPIVFANVPDPVANGLVVSLTRPGGNITGFANYEPAIAVKWLELLKQIAPRVARVAFIYDPANPTTAAYLQELETAASSFGVQVSGAVVRSAEDIERAIDTFAREPNGGVIVPSGPATTSHETQVITLAARKQLPAVYPTRTAVMAGGLVSYGVNTNELFRSAASYVDRILRGEKPGDLPVQFATKFELVLNLKTAKALGLDPPISLLARTDEVIE